MNYKYIAETAGQKVAQRIEKDNEINYKAVDAEALDDWARGALVLGVEPIDYPDTDGLLIYLKRPAGGVVGLLIETEPDEMGIYEFLHTSVAAIREEAHAKEL